MKNIYHNFYRKIIFNASALRFNNLKRAPIQDKTTEYSSMK